MGELHVDVMGRGFSWFDIGTHESWMEACKFVQILEQRQGLRISSPEEVAFESKFITAEQLLAAANSVSNSQYGRYLKEIYEANVKTGTPS